MFSIDALSFKKSFHFVYPSGKPMPPHLLRCQGLAVDDYSFTLGRLKAGATSTFAQLGFIAAVNPVYKISRRIFGAIQINRHRPAKAGFKKHFLNITA